MRPLRVVRAYRRRYSDNGDHKAYVDWSDGSRTEGRPYSRFMLDLFARARREGVKVTRDDW